MGRITQRTPTTRITADGARNRRVDTVAVEEPLSLRVDGEVIVVTMRTPGDDFDLALGYLYGEGVINGADDVVTLMHCVDEDESGRATFNVVDVTTRSGAADRAALQRAKRVGFVSGACGICGSQAIDDLLPRLRHRPAADDTSFDPALVAAMPDTLRAAQRTFDKTGGTHAAGLFDAAGELLALREDVGRHNAVDKLIGAALRQGRASLSGMAIQLSGRAGYELVAKAAVAGAPLVASVSATTSLAVETADAVGLTLVAFNRPGRMTVHTRADRLSPPDIREQ